jgi:L-ascorbate metabolism protein UlaG (beta-lactamase superfamily)
MFEYGGLLFSYVGHSCFLIRGQKTVCTDPFDVKRSADKADVITCTHDHFDHCSPSDMKKFTKDSTTILASVNCRGKISGLKAKEIVYLKPGDSTEVSGMRFTAVPAYNVNKFRSPGVVYHPKEYRGIGVIFEMGGVIVYHAGDTDVIPEMSDFGKVDVALLPVSGTYVMTAQEAAEAVKLIKPKVAIPMHFGSIVGGVDDAKKFKEMVEAETDTKAVVLERGG